MEFFSHFYNIRRKIVIILVFILVFQNFFKEKKSLSNFYILPMSVRISIAKFLHYFIDQVNLEKLVWNIHKPIYWRLVYTYIYTNVYSN